MALNPRFIHHVHVELAKIGNTLFNLGQINAAMAMADRLLAEETNAASLEVQASALEDVDAIANNSVGEELVTALDDLSTQETPKTSEEPRMESEAPTAAEETQLPSPEEPDPEVMAEVGQTSSDTTQHPNSRGRRSRR